MTWPAEFNDTIDCACPCWQLSATLEIDRRLEFLLHDEIHAPEEL
jgi:hypothetical protein